jgi:DNA polymerase/3'-5' exonuclease PolX
VDLVCALIEGKESAGTEITAAFTQFPEVTRILGQGGTKASVLTAGALQVDLRIVPAENFGAALLYFTGSKEHGVKIRGLALDKEMTLNEWGLYALKDHEKAEKRPGNHPGSRRWRAEPNPTFIRNSAWFMWNPNCAKIVVKWKHRWPISCPG